MVEMEELEPGMGTGVSSFANSAAAGELRRALVVAYGVETGADLFAEVLEHAVREWDRVESMENISGYLWTVARGKSRRYGRWARTVAFPADRLDRVSTDPDHELFLSLGGLRPEERTAVVLIHSFGATYQEVADLLGVPLSTVTNLVHRGLAKLRHELKEIP